MPQVHIVAYCGDLGYGVARGAEMLSVMLFLGIVSRIGSGIVADRIGGSATLMIGSFMQGVAPLLYLYFNGLASLYLASAIFGLFQGGIVPMYAVICRELLPPREAGARIGLVVAATIFGMAFGGYLSVLINYCDPIAARELARTGALKIDSQIKPVPILASIPTVPNLSAPRVIDVARGLGFEIFNRGDIETARAEAVLVAARSCEKLLGHLSPGTLVITPADRSDAILATALVAQRGMPLAGFVLTCGGPPAPEVAGILSRPPLNRLPILLTNDDTYTTATRLSGLTKHTSEDDPDRMERVIAFMADRIDVAPLARRVDLPGDALMPPPVFRHRLVATARAVP